MDGTPGAPRHTLAQRVISWNRRLLFRGVTPAAAAVVTLAVASHASATGGLLPQSSESVPNVTITDTVAVFIEDGSDIQMQLRMEFDLTASGQAATTHALAWVVPLSGTTEVSVGSERLFTNLGAATVPRWSTQITESSCGEPVDPTQPSPTEPSPTADPEAMPDPLEPPVTIGMVGAFDATVLRPGDGVSVLEWLSSRGYAAPPPANELLLEYADASATFAVTQLLGHEGHNVVHPIALRFTGAAELPLRLAQLSAATRLDIAVYGLGASRWIPTGVPQVELNPLRLNWLGLGDGYDDVVAAAVDDPIANGLGFVTETVLRSPEVSAQGLVDTRWNAETFASLLSSQVAGELLRQGLYLCYEDLDSTTCRPTHPLIDGIVETFLLPGGTTFSQLFECPQCYQDSLIWQRDQFVDAIQTRIIDPGLQAQALLLPPRTVSRMYARPDRESLTTDPGWAVQTIDPVLRSRSRVATAQRRCDGDLVVSLPDQREVVVPGGGPWPSFDEAMPFVQRIEALRVDDDPEVLLDNVDAIDEALAEHNRIHGWPPGAGCSVDAGHSGRHSVWLLLLGAFGLRRHRRRYHSATVTKAGRLMSILGALTLSACAGRARNESQPGARPITLADIESELLNNERALRDAGIDVSDTTGVTSPEPATPTDPDVPEVAPETELSPKPEPAPEPEPTPVVEASEDEDDSPMLSSRRDVREESVDAESVSKRSTKASRGRPSWGGRGAERRRRKQSSTRCERICDLAEATCDLAAHICELAEIHLNEPRYQQACYRAERQCGRASDACGRCELGGE